MIDGCIEAFIIDKSTANSKSKLKEHRLSYNNLDAALHYAYLLNTLQNPTNKNDSQSKSSKKLKHVHLTPIIFFKLVITSGKKYRKSKTLLIKYLVDSEDSEYIITKAKSDKIPVNITKHEQQWLTASGVLTTSTKTATRFSFPELHYNELINQSIHVVDLNIDRYDIIIGRYLITFLGIDIHSADMTIHWDDAAIPWRDIDFTTNDVILLSPHNALFNSETKIMKCILDAKY